MVPEVLKVPQAAAPGGCCMHCTPQVCCFVHLSVISNSLWPHRLQPERLLSMGFYRQEYWSGLPFPSPGDLPDQVRHTAGKFFTVWATREADTKQTPTSSTLWFSWCRVRSSWQIHSPGQLLWPEVNTHLASLVAQRLKCLSAMQDTRGSIPGLGRCPGEGNGSPLQYSCLENPIDGGAW